MRRAHAIVVLAMLLPFGLSFAIPVDNLPETSYDESEPAPYEIAPQIWTLMLAESGRFASDAGRLVLPIRLSATLEPYSGQTFRLVHLRFVVAPSLMAQVFPLRC
jgi:hypothetical protein